VASLEQAAISSPDGSRWTEENFLAALRMLGE
jgi:hypothetical protein